jgi:hypothetical protein
MNKELAHVLRLRLVPLPFADVVAGLAQTLTSIKAIGDEEAKTNITQKFPVSYDVSVAGQECMGQEWPLIPDSNKKSIMYFEDFGISLTERHNNMNYYTSRLRFICWMNRANLVSSGIYTEVAGPAMNAVINKLQGTGATSQGMITALTVQVTTIPPQDAALFGRYSYDENTRQYLRPPFEFFGLDLTCKYRVSDDCIQDIDWTGTSCF